MYTMLIGHRAFSNEYTVEPRNVDSSLYWMLPAGPECSTGHLSNLESGHSVAFPLALATHYNFHLSNVDNHFVYH